MLIVNPDRKSVLIMEKQEGFSVIKRDALYALVAHKPFAVDCDYANENIIISQNKNYVNNLLDFIIQGYAEGYDVLYLPKENEQGRRLRINKCDFTISKVGDTNL